MASGKGYGAFETISIYWENPLTLLGTAVADRSGRFTGDPFTIPSSGLTGGADYRINGIGTNVPQATRERGLKLMFPLAVTVCHAKLNPGRFDFVRCVQISKEAGYQGVYSIEAGGKGDPYYAVRQVVDALIENL